MRNRIAVAVFALPAVAFAIAGCGGSADTNGSSSSGASTAATAGSGSTKLALVAYSTPQKVYADAIAAFNKTPAGSGIAFTESFGASGDQSRSVVEGLPADVVNFSLAPDITRLVKAGLVSSTWNANANKGIVSDSLVVFVVRKGNPKHISGWSDLVRPGVGVLTPNPFSSGSAKWNLVAAYGAELKLGKTPAQADAYLQTLITKNVKAQDKSASAALQDFLSGNGDVLLSYESDAISAQKKGEPIDFVRPAQTILIEEPIAIASKTAHPTQAQAFVNFLWSAAGQAIFAKHGYRPVDAAVLKKYASSFPTPKDVFTIKQLGGWTAVDKQFFATPNGTIAKIESGAGVSTAQ